MVEHVQGRASDGAVAEHEATTSPRMRVREGNITGIARRNFEICVDANESSSVSDDVASIDVVKMGADVDETVVTLRGDNE